MAKSKTVKKKKNNQKVQNSSIFGPIQKSKPQPQPHKGNKATKAKKTVLSKSVPHKAASHRYKRHAAKVSHPPVVNLRRHMSKETRVSVRQIKFHLTLPNNAPRFRDTPWFRDGIVAVEESSSFFNQTSRIQLPTGRVVSQASWSKLDQELLCFADYVRLSPEEHDAREFVIQQVTDIAGTLFVSSSSSSGEKRKRGEDRVRIQAFGSFATPQVCTFASDVDLALWGIVPVVPRHTVFSSTKEDDDDKEGKQMSQKDKNARLKKWKDALAELDATEREDEDVLEKELKPAAVDKQDSNAGAETAKAQTPDRAARNQDTNEKAKTAKLQATDHLVGVSAQTEASTKHVGDENMPQNEVKASSVDKMADANKNAAAKAQPTDEQAQLDASVRRFDDTEGLGGLLFVIDREGTNEFQADSEDLDGDQAGESRTEAPNKPPQHDSQAAKSALPQLDDTMEDARASTRHSQPADDSDTDPNKSAQPSEESSWKGAGSASAPLVVDDDESDHSTIDLCSDSDDTADKLESYEKTSATTNDDEDKAPTVSLSSTASIASTASTDQVAVSEGWADEDEPDVLFVSHASKEATVPNTVGPTGENRKLVVNALKRLGRALWKSQVIHTVEVRKFARVPIITTGTHLGFEGDIAMGGHNGADTSQYASSQAQRFKSFAPVVLLLKILLAQQALDKPFTGGLGSYKLYVLVAHHMEEHIALGGADRPSEVLLAFFFRFRKWCGDRRHQYRRGSAETHLSPHSMISCDGGSAELKPVFNLEHCCKLFDQSWTRLTNELQSDNSTMSFLGHLVKANQLRSERNIFQKKASQLARYSQSQPRSPNRDGELSINYSHVFSKPTFIQDSTKIEALPLDADAEDLMAGYGMKSGPRGGLIPRNRPDVQARRSVSEVVGRALKNRKNKKKQKRDQGLKSIALRNV